MSVIGRKAGLARGQRVGGAHADEALVNKVREFAEKRGARVVTICGQLEAELSSLPEAERSDFLTEMGLTESGLVRLTREAYTLLNLITFFTAGEVESRAWPLRNGLTAPQAAGKIHSDMERGFIRAEVYHPTMTWWLAGRKQK